MKSKVFLPAAVLALSFGAIACGDSGDDTPSGLDCGTCGTNQVCDTTTGRCVGCRTSSDCHAPTAICRPADHTCVECLNNDQCPGDQTCNLGVCESAQEDECGPGKPCADGDCVEGHCIPVTQCTPADAATTCPGSECLADGTCLNSKKTLCTQSGAPLHASYIDEMVNVAWTAENGWTAPAKCQWTCDGGYVPSADGNSCVTAPECDGPSDCAPDGVCEGGACLGSRQKECDSSGVPAHATARQEQVTVTWTPGTGWSKPAACKWDCDGTYVPTSDGKGCEEAPECTKNSDCVPDGECYNKSCLGSKKVSCDSSATPDHAKPTVVEVTITWTAGSGWTRAEKCAWTCDKGYEPDGKGGCKETVVVTECTPGTCTGNVFCTESKEELNCGDDHCVPGKGCSACTTDQHCLDSEGAGTYCNASNQCVDVTCTGCKATYETCDTTTHDSQGKGQCVPATCSSNKCSGDYACLSGHYSLCQYGCSNNACKSAPVGCAAATDPDEYCVNQAEAQGNHNIECDVTTGSCVECLTDANCGSNSGKECKNHVCTSKCGNGKLDSGEVCDPALASSGWAQYYRSCEDMSGGYQTGNVYCEADCKNVNADDCHLATCRNNKADSGEDCDPTVDKSEWKYPTCKAYDDSFMGTIACTSQCTIDDSGCELDPCSDVPDLEFGCGVEERYNQACNVFFKDDSTVTENIVCTSHPTCAGKRVIDMDATLEKCFPVVEKVAVNWCSTQDDNGNYGFTLDTSNPSHTFYGQVYVENGITGNSGSHAGVKGQLAVYDSNMNATYHDATRNTGFGGGEYGNNDEWMVTLTTADFTAGGEYNYIWRFSADNGASWYYCWDSSWEGGADDDETAYMEFSDDNVINVSKQAGHLVINQLMITGATAGDEFVELYNPTSSPIDLSKYVLWKTTKSNWSPTSKIILSGTIPAKGFYLIASKNNDTGATGLSNFPGAVADLEVANKSGLFGGINNKAILILTNTQDSPTADKTNVVDILGQSSEAGIYEGSAVTNNSTNYNSIIRTPDGQDTDNNSKDFTLRTTACPRSTAVTTCPTLTK